MRQAPGVLDSIELNELNMEQPGETLETPVFAKHTRIEWCSSKVWKSNVTGGVPEAASAGMGRGRGCKGRSEESG